MSGNGIERTLGKIEMGIEFLKDSHAENRKNILSIKDKLSRGEGKISLLKEKCSEFEKSSKEEKIQREKNTDFRKEVKVKVGIYTTVVTSVLGFLAWIGNKFFGGS